MSVFIILFFALLSWLAAESYLHEKNLRRVPLRIMVNGTRGKSSVTRLITAGLRAGGYRAIGKTTGARPKILLPDGEEAEVKRCGAANIREIIAFARLAARLDADAMVVECMAVCPQLQRFTGRRLVQPHIGVVTNVRADHEDVMGRGLESIASAFAGALNPEGVLVTTPQAYTYLSRFLDGYAPRFIHLVDEEGLAKKDTPGFPYEVVDENIALAIKVCQLAGVDPAASLAGMRGARPDPGNITVSRISLQNKTFTFINAAAANDPESTLLLWRRYAAGINPLAVLLNCRRDRRYRTGQLAGALAGVHKQTFLVAGDTAFARNALLRKGVDKRRIIKLPGEVTRASLIRALESTGSLTAVFAAGNVKGLEALLEIQKD